ncbi:MAG: hypothetical protein K5829_04030 [Treponema sp.]|nr:hypothetical protein [Treponema sp.]
MIKKSLLILVFSLFIHFIYADINADCKSLKAYFEQCYVNYDEDCKNGFDIDKCIKKIKKYYKWYYKQYNPKINSWFKTNREECAFTSAIAFALSEDLPQKDSHLNVKFQDFGNSVFAKNLNFYSEVYLEERDNGFYVFDSKAPNIKNGMRYDDKNEWLKKCIHNKKECFMLVIPSVAPIKEVKIRFDSKEVIVPLNANLFFKNKDFISYKETSDSVYIGFGTSPYLWGTDNQALKDELDIYIEKLFKKSDSFNLIVDLRSNSGGYDFLDYFWQRFFFKNDYDAQNMYIKLLDQAQFGTIELNSLQVAEKKYSYTLENFPNDEELIASRLSELKDLQNNNRRFYSGLENLPRQSLPQTNKSWFKGKVYVLIDNKTASSAEKGLAAAFLIDKNQIILVGENSRGCIEFGGAYYYELPSEKVNIKLADISYKNTALIKFNPCWKGETEGFYPDYWAFKNNLIDTLIYLTSDSEISSVLAGLENGML